MKSTVKTTVIQIQKEKGKPDLIWIGGCGDDEIGWLLCEERKIKNIQKTDCPYCGTPLILRGIGSDATPSLCCKPCRRIIHEVDIETGAIIKSYPYLPDRPDRPYIKSEVEK